MYLYHEFLVEGNTFEFCSKKVLRFFDLYELISYDSIEPLGQRSIPGSHPLFWERLEMGMFENRNVLDSLLSELKETGARSLSDLKTMAQGYETKLLHQITHLLDGFFGIDSYFYNLVEDSHWVTKQCRKKISLNSDRYWLVAVDCSTGPESQGFERKAPSSLLL